MFLLLVILLVLFLVFRKDYSTILASIKKISVLDLLLLLGMGVGYQLLDAAAMLAIEYGWLKTAIPEELKYLLPGFLVCAGIVAVLLLLCTWKKLQRLLLYFIARLPDTGKWKEQKSIWTENLDALYKEAGCAVQNKTCCMKIFLLNACKLFWLYSIPFLCLQILEIPGLTFTHVQALAAIMFLIVGVIPNVAGMGPAEFAFLLLFSPCIGRGFASSSLILYRISTYFFPFLLSAGFVMKTGTLHD